MRIARLVLADGTIFRGEAFGATTTRGGEIVFNTAHTGYQEVITDPSYCGQLICMTSPQQGNYGVNERDHEAPRTWVEGFIVRERALTASNYRSRLALDEALAAAGIPGISGVNTRAVTLRLRTSGAINGVLSTSDAASDDELIAQARALPDMSGQDLVRRVAPDGFTSWSRGLAEEDDAPPHTALLAARQRPVDRHVVALDCGMKRNILRNLVDIGCRVTVAPPTAAVEEILRLEPDGVFLSNGPGDPAAVTYVHELVRALAPRAPIFGICLGHQMLALALGAKTYKLRFGHHGYNHPVKNLMTGRVEITSQNHGFAVDEETLAACGLTPTHVNLYDGTNEGFRHLELPLFAVQYHPEAAPGPQDSSYLFDCFRRVIETRRPPTVEDMAVCQAQTLGQTRAG